MTGRTHDLVSFASLLTITSIFPPVSLNLTTAIASMVGGVVGALIPDLDQATKRLYDLLPGGNFVGRMFRHLMLGHRTLSHSILGVYIIYKILTLVIPILLNPIYVDVQIIITSIMIGIISHIFADSLTKDGVPLFFPFKINVGFPPIKKLRITTGKFVENFMVFPMVIVYIFYLVYTKKEVFLTLIHLIRS